MSKLMTLLSVVAVLVAVAVPTLAQEAVETSTGDPEPGKAASIETPSVEAAAENAPQVLESAGEKAGAIAEAVDRNEQARDVSAGILEPIYKLAEAFSFPAFHWLAFTVMVTGLVSFALQLTLGKLVVLARLGFSVSEVCSDALGLVVSLVGLVLTTQAATENSSFTSSASAVLSATAVGALIGFVFYVWGQRQELQAVEGRKAVARHQHD